MPYFDELVEGVKIQITSKSSRRYYTTKRVIRDLLSDTPNCVFRNFNPIRRLRVVRKTCLIGPRVNIRFGRYMHCTMCSWIINETFPC